MKKTTINKMKKMIVDEMIKNIGDYELIDIVSKLDELTNSGYDNVRVYAMGAIDDLLSGETPTEVLSRVASDFNIHHEYFGYNGYGNIVSYSTAEDFYNKHQNLIDELYNELLVYHINGDLDIRDYTNDSTIIDLLDIYDEGV